MVNGTIQSENIVTQRPDVDLLSGDFYRNDPHPVFTWMRANEPVFRDHRNELWAVTRHADLLDVERRSQIFASGPGYRSFPSPEENNMIAQDDPEHQRQRRLVSARFTPAAVRYHNAWLTATIDSLIDHRIGDGQMEVIADLAAQLPCRLTARLLGWPEERWTDIKRWSERLMRIDAAPTDEVALNDLMTTIGEFFPAVLATAAERRVCPADDLISAWANAEVDGFTYDDVRMLHETGLFIAGGAETTRTVIAHGLATFADHADQWERLAANPDLIPSAVDELIRWVTPLNNFFRTATEDTKIGEQPIAAGDRVILLYPSANRDEAVFDDPFVFDIERSPNPHVAFGYGTHFCLGANLAKYELGLLFERLAARLTNLRVVSAPDVESNIFARAVRSFTLEFSARP